MYNQVLSLKFRGAGRQGIQSLKLYGMLEDVEPDPKKKPEAFNAGRRLSVYNSHELMVMASYLWNEGKSSLTEEEMEEARALLKKWEVLTALQQAFRPTHDCPEWLHKAWKVLQTEDGRRGEEDPRRKRREELNERVIT